ncbi:hypothetical protein PFICI_03611 [Pestalotiopsis fici W106-1]|uniref:Uncharacterized protein n=1 Tax=Pestalotiopsis fici (strain W106-1 / CGMCC3.15140) TaxID=1229662 RepID=W3XK16_PESFW|nr:uncharacterized protein PFICI_03611 [Pestalotiopsis fici W106-1]ETS85586.1 hypothetical protein PFICI_03611 [Pestalotiopsis fici W106-1]
MLEAGFRRANWSWVSCDPAKLQTLDDKTQRLHETWIPEFEDLDNNSIRFAFPAGYERIGNEPVAFILPSFVGLGPPRLGSMEASQGETEQEGRPSQRNEISQAKTLLQDDEVLQETPPPAEIKPLPESESRLEPHPLQPRESLLDTKTLPDLINPANIMQPPEEQPHEEQSHEEQLHEEQPHEEQPHAQQPNEKGATDDPRFTCVDGFLYYPTLPVLLESLIRARLRIPEDTFGMWRSMLEVWAISYLWGQTMAPEDVLDGIEDDDIKAWFNKETKRFEGGIDRVTITKRKGRLTGTRPIVDIDL